MNIKKSLSIEKINSVLPQTQCRECGYQGCKPYATALLAGETTIDRCPPGGTKTLQALGELLEQDSSPYLQKMQEKYRSPQIAKIDEDLCIGCVKCIKACPVDAIIGSHKLMHTVISDHCTGCELCIEPCPMDCISLIPIAEPSETASKQKAQLSRIRYEKRQQRLKKIADEKKPRQTQQQDKNNITAQRKAYIDDAVLRVKEKLAKYQGKPTDHE